MGMDLTVCPMRHKGEGWWLAYDRLGFNRDYKLFEYMGLRGETIFKHFPIPDGTRFDWYGDEGIERTTEDSYGTPLSYVMAHEFKKISDDGLSDWNKAVLAMLRELPEDTPVVLYWH